MGLCRFSDVSCWNLIYFCLAERCYDSFSICCMRGINYFVSHWAKSNILEHHVPFGFPNLILSGMVQITNNFISSLSVSPDGLLLQSSTVADSVSFSFSDGVTESVPCSYIEFAERLILPQFKDLPEKEVRHPFLPRLCSLIPNYLLSNTYNDYAFSVLIRHVPSLYFY